MSQVEAFNDNATATQPSMVIAMTRPRSMAAELAAAERDEQGVETPAPAGGTTASGWPQWPNAWPDGSRQS